MRHRLIGLVQTVKEAGSRWMEDDAMRLSAALSYYTIFSLGPLLILAVGISGLIFGPEAASGELRTQLESLIGLDAAQAVQNLLAASWHPKANWLASGIGLVILIFGATSVFAELNDGLNLIWRADPAKLVGWRSWLRHRLLSVAMILSIGFLLLVSLLFSAAVAAAGRYLYHLIRIPPVFFQVYSDLFSLCLITVLFALLFKYLPDRRVAWKDVWLGAALTSLLFTIGKQLIGLYLGKIAVKSTYGASASIIILLVWTYYSSLILYFGAEFTEVYSRHLGSQANVPARPRQRGGALTLAHSRS